MRTNTEKHTIGFLTFDIAGTYNNTMWRHLFNAARNRNIEMITFCGGVLLDESILHRQWNKIYDLASAQRIDGLIVLSASLSQSCGKDKLSEFLKRFSPIPVVSIGVELEDAVSILLDNKEGMRQIVSHMLDEHDASKVLFLAGPQNNDEAHLRLSVFRDEMTKRGLPVNDELIRHVSYRYDLAIEAVEEVIKSGIAFDSIIAVNDDSALGAFDVLKKHGIKVPHEISLSGFDNTDQSQCNAVPLTTVQQPHREMAESALEAMRSVLSGDKVEKRRLIPAKLIIRNSCGCILNNYISQKDYIAGKKTKQEIIQSTVFTKPDNFDILQKHFEEFMSNDDSSKLLYLFNEELLSSLENNGNDEVFTGWHNFLTAWNADILESSDYNSIQKNSAAFFFESARFMIIEAEKNLFAAKRLETQKKDYLFILFSSYFSPLIDMKNYLNHISRELPKFGVTSFFISLFCDKELSKSKIVLYYLPNGNTYWNIDGKEFPSNELLPEECTIGGSSNLVIEPLLNYEEIIGYFVFQLAEPAEIIENIRQLVSNSFLSILLAQEVIKDKQLKTLLQNLETKQELLEEAYHSLKENQEKMLVIDKMASLGKMTAGIAHEMNTPVASIRTSLSEISRLTEEYDKSIGDPDVSDDDHREIAAEIKHSLNLAEKAAEKAASFVHGIKSQTRDLDPKDRFHFNAVEVIRETLLLLSHSLKQSKCEIKLTFERDYIEINGVPGRLSQVITNLVNNAIEACPNDGSGKIEVSIIETEKEVILSVTDNGSGISKENLTKIFDPMFTTKPFGVGTGLGLTLVHNIVCAEFGGSIEVTNGINGGTKFIIHLKSDQEDHIGSKI
ncbi:MAG TPA: substrate-binding domain-containing protein [Spirochaetota bacterium]|nr:substrate-binding domain-containing protein [Spirochaetota bacterium]